MYYVIQTHIFSWLVMLSAVLSVATLHCWLFSCWVHVEMVKQENRSMKTTSDDGKALSESVGVGGVKIKLGKHEWCHNCSQNTTKVQIFKVIHWDWYCKHISSCEPNQRKIPLCDIKTVIRIHISYRDRIFFTFLRFAVLWWSPRHHSLK